MYFQEPYTINNATVLFDAKIACCRTLLFLLDMGGGNL